MGQFGFFDANDRLEALSAKGDPLEAIDALVPWESFRKAIEAEGRRGLVEGLWWQLSLTARSEGEPPAGSR